jgi:hypothetical protein
MESALEPAELLVAEPVALTHIRIGYARGTNLTEMNTTTDQRQRRAPHIRCFSARTTGTRYHGPSR